MKSDLHGVMPIGCVGRIPFQRDALSAGHRDLRRVAFAYVTHAMILIATLRRDRMETASLGHGKEAEIPQQPVRCCLCANTAWAVRIKRWSSNEGLVDYKKNRAVDRFATHGPAN